MSRRSLFLFAPLLASLLASSSYAAPARSRAAISAPAKRVVRHANFDWDDNIVVMVTRMYLRSKTGAPEMALSTAEWAHVKNEVGKPGKYEDRYLDGDFAAGGFRDFRDVGPENVFLRDLKRSIEGGAGWRGPSWRAFVEQLSTREGARNLSITTAREHSAETIYAGLRYLQLKGLIRYLPLKENLHAVNNPSASADGQALTGTTPERKLAVQRAILDRLERAALKQPRLVHRYHFSDDDWSNYDATRLGLSPDIVTGRWKNVTVKLHFTGLDHPQNPPQSTELRHPN